MECNAQENTGYPGLQLLHDAYVAFKDSFLNGAMLVQLGQRINGYMGF